MNDLDFDELDRAVTALTGSADSGHASTPSPKPDLKPLGALNSRPQTPSLGSLAGRRAVGRSMDIIVGKNRDKPIAPRPSLQSTSESSTPVNAPQTPPPVHSWPDPIDFHNSNNKPDDSLNIQSDKTAAINKDDVDASDDDIDKIAQDISNTMSHDKENDSPESPFLAGTKVEKRPLGAFSADNAPKTETNDVDADIANKMNNILGVDNKSAVETPADVQQSNEPVSQPLAKVDSITPLPAELSSDVLSAESGMSLPDESQIAKQDERTVAGSDDKPVAAAEVNTPVAAADNTTSDQINQQYTEKPTSGDKPTGNVYNTDAHHKAVLHPSKKKSSWLVVLWILLLLIVGAASGAAAYFFILPK